MRWEMGDDTLGIDEVFKVSSNDQLFSGGMGYIYV